MGYYVLTAVGRDRPGIVEALSGFLQERGANIEDSRMATLGGEFAVMLLFAVSEADQSALEGALGALGAKEDFTLSLRATTGTAQAPKSAQLRIEAVALDHPGIVHQISRLLRELGLSINGLATELRPAPVSGSPMFALSADVTLLPGTRMEEIEQALEQLALRENLDLRVSRTAPSD